MISGTTLANNRSIGFALLLSCAQFLSSPALSQETETAPLEPLSTSPTADELDPAPATPEPEEREQPPASVQPQAIELPESLQPEAAVWEPWSNRVDGLIEQITNLEKDANDADILFIEMAEALRHRLSHLRSNLTWARSPRPR